MNIDNTKNEAWRQLLIPTKKRNLEKKLEIEITTYPIKEKAWKSFGIEMTTMYPT
jgi:hypothetical protein